jgi:hydroxymethylpyrimidine/phosphomethylpyrimidine kinase
MPTTQNIISDRYPGAEQGSGRPYVLSIAGFDPSAGAGILADIKTFEGNGAYGFGAVSALTWQNDIEFARVEWIDPGKIIEQVSMLLKRFDIRFIKIGLIESMDVLTTLISYLQSAIEDPVIIYDPILKASAGFVFHTDAAKEQFLKTLPDVYCITPNIPEAQQLFGEGDIDGVLEDISESVNIYLKGGHGTTGTSIDALFTKDHTYAFSNERLRNGAKHGSGCVLSAALTAQLALGNDLPVAAENANSYTYRFLASTETLLGYHQSAQS